MASMLVSGTAPKMFCPPLPRSYGLDRSNPGPASRDARARLQAIVAHVEPPPRRTAWANLLQRVFEVDALRCPRCGGRMRVLSAITDPDVARRILESLDMPSRAPPLGAPSPEPEMLGDDSSPERPWVEDPGFNFDQSLPESR